MKKKTGEGSIKWAVQKMTCSNDSRTFWGKKSADSLAILIGCGILLSLGIAVPPMYLLFCQCFQQFNQRHSIIQVILQDLHFVWCVFQLLIYQVGECLLLHIYPYWVGAIYALTILLRQGGGHRQLEENGI